MSLELGSILGNLVGRMLGRDKPKPQAAPPKPTTTAAPAPAPRPAGAPAQAVDIEPILDGMAAKAGQKLNWRTSIVDLMKLLDIDSSLENRKALAKELGYTGDTATAPR